MQNYITTFANKMASHPFLSFSQTHSSKSNEQYSCKQHFMAFEVIVTIIYHQIDI